MYYSFNSHTSLLLWLLTHHWVGPVWPGRAGAEGCWIPDHRGGWTGEPPPEQNPAGKAPAAGLAAPAPRKGAAWTSHLRETPNGERMCEAKQFKRGFFILWFLELMAVLFFALNHFLFMRLSKQICDFRFGQNNRSWIHLPQYESLSTGNGHMLSWCHFACLLFFPF